MRPPQAVNLENDLSQNRKVYKQKWKKYFVISQIPTQAMSYQVTLSLHTLGYEALKVYTEFDFFYPLRQTHCVGNSGQI